MKQSTTLLLSIIGAVLFVPNAQSQLVMSPTDQEEAQMSMIVNMNPEQSRRLGSFGLYNPLLGRKEYENPCDDPAYGCCHLSNSEECSLADLPLNRRTYIHPGGDTKCFKGTPYRFEVIRGKNPKKALVYFQGGGACWNGFSSHYLQTCKREAFHYGPNSKFGIFSRENRQNPYRDWTIIHVLYCTGDAHLGDSTVRDYNLFGQRKKADVQQVGSRNVQSVIDWMKKQTMFQQPLDDLVMMGCSAGTLALPFYAPYFMKTFPATRAAVTLDSYVGLTDDDEDYDSQLIQRFGACDKDMLFYADPTGKLQQACKDGALKIPMLTAAMVKNFPDVQFLMVNSKSDIIQRGMYAAATARWMSKGEYYVRMTDLISKLKMYPNFASFLIEGGGHCYTNGANVFRLSVSGEVIDDDHNTRDAGGIAASLNGGPDESYLGTILRDVPPHNKQWVKQSSCFGKPNTNNDTIQLDECLE